MRFPEFTDEWKRCTLEDCADFLDGLRKPIKSEDRKCEKGLYPYYGASGIIDYIDEYIFDGEYVLLSEDGANILDRNYRVAFIARGKIWVNNHAHVLLPYKNIDINFLSEALERLNYAIYNTGTTMPNLNQEVCRKICLNIPSREEQNKIGNLLFLLNERIATQNKIIEDLKKLKSAIAETLFCTPKESMPAKRVSPYNKEWKLIKLSDICQRVQTKNTGNQCRQVLTIAAQHGLVNQEDFFNKTVASENLEGYYLLQKGDFAYNKSYSGGYTWGAIKRLEWYDKGVLSPLYICFRPDSSKVNADFLAHYFESKKWHKGIADIAGEGARNHGLLNISVIDFFNTIHRIPDLDEQKDIARILNSLSSKLSCEQRVIQNLTMQRSYLLHKMFI